MSWPSSMSHTGARFCNKTFHRFSKVCFEIIFLCHLFLSLMILKLSSALFLWLTWSLILFSYLCQQSVQQTRIYLRLRFWLDYLVKYDEIDAKDCSGIKKISRTVVAVNGTTRKWILGQADKQRRHRWPDKNDTKAASNGPIFRTGQPPVVW